MPRMDSINFPFSLGRAKLDQAPLPDRSQTLIVRTEENSEEDWQLIEVWVSMQAHRSTRLPRGESLALRACYYGEPSRAVH